MLKLACNQDPQALGIANEAGDWDLARFEEHLKACDTCKKFMLEMFGRCEEEDKENP